MPLFQIAAAQPSFQTCVHASRVETLFYGKFVVGDEKRFCPSSASWKAVRLPKKEKDFNLRLIARNGSLVVIRAVATFESVCSDQKIGSHEGHSRDPESQQQSLDDDSEPDEREKLRRMRISKANKGNTPWNKGRKHSPETLQRIRERTKLAMQNPKVKMKLINLGHAQSNETRAKIGIGVRIGWERRREKLMLQETCHFEWQNLIAEASRRGFVGEEELQWDSYKILDEQLKQEWLESVQRRKKTPRPKGSKRAPKSAEQRKKISEAIAAKWADPAYRERVCSALSKYHSIPVGTERKPTRRPVAEEQPKVRSPVKRKTKVTEKSTENQMNQRPRLRRSKMPVYKDPLASSKLERIKNIRAQRAAKETKKTDAIERAKLLIAEAEKAAKALEVAATRSPLAQASLIEARKLIAEAIESIQSIENGDHGSINSAGLATCVERENSMSIEEFCVTNQKGINSIRQVNGFHLESDGSDVGDFGFTNFSFHDFLNGTNKVLSQNTTDRNSLNAEKPFQANSNLNCFPSIELDSSLMGSSFSNNLSQLEPHPSDNHEKGLQPNGTKLQSRTKEKPLTSTSVTKKWVRGRLVQVPDGA